MSLYNIVYADPPYSYKNRKTGGSLRSGSAAKYPTLTIEEICDLPIKQITSKDSVLFLWMPVPLKIPYAQMILDSWGFGYKTTLYWRKIMSLGMGFWFRGQVEELILAVRGKVKAFRYQHANFIQSKALKHSHKPESFRHLIENATAKMPNQERLELFATREVEGWDCFGLEIDGRDIREVLDELVDSLKDEFKKERRIRKQTIRGTGFEDSEVSLFDILESFTEDEN